MRLNRAPGPLLGLLLLAGCAESGAPPEIVVGEVPAQRVMPGNTALGQACAGHSPSSGIAVAPGALYGIEARLSELRGGAPSPFASIAAPADFGVRRWTRPVFLPGRTAAACAGLALKTQVREEANGRWLDYQLELALPPGADPEGGERLPADPYRIRNTVRVDAAGRALQRLGFRAAGRAYVLDVAVSPGPGWRRERALARGSAAEPRGAIGTSRVLPDERPGRTLEDVLQSR